MNKVKLSTYLSVLLVFISCNNTTKKSDNSAEIAHSKTKIAYAKGFKIERYTNFTKIVVQNPWDTTQILETYILIDRTKKTPDNLPAGNVVKVPVQRVATCSSIFAGEYKQLGEIQKIVAVSEPQYVDIPEIKEGLNKGSIIDLGMTVTLNTEKLLAANADILVISPFEESMHDRFKSLGMCIVKDASYMENSPLGRAEWIKFEAAFLGKDSLANEIFSKTEQRYKTICQKVMTTKNRPTVFTEKKTGDIWYIAGGNSYMACFFKDAGAKYLWHDLKISGSVPYTFEKVFAKVIDADYWLLKYNNVQSNLSLAQLGSEYELYKNFKAFREQSVYGVNSGKTAFYEEGPLEPDVILADFVKIFHPELLPEYTPKYYLKIN